MERTTVIKSEGNMRINKKRDVYLDFYRGLASVSVIFIHTAFHSGQTYVPYWAQNLTLLLDVPFFFFLSGWAGTIRKDTVEKQEVLDIKGQRAIKKALKGIVQIWKKWLFFLIVIQIGCVFFNISGFTSIFDFLNALFFINVSIGTFSSVGSSIWFLPVYVVVTFWMGFWMDWMDSGSANTSINKRPMLISGMAICFMGIVYSTLGGTFFYMSSYFWFYSFFYILGYILAQYRVKNIREGLVSVCAFVLLWIGIAQIVQIPAIDLQKAKFPPIAMYWAASMISVVIALILKGRLPRFLVGSFIQKIGRNVIWFYYAQGIGSSLLFFTLEIRLALHFGDGNCY